MTEVIEFLGRPADHSTEYFGTPDFKESAATTLTLDFHGGFLNFESNYP